MTMGSVFRGLALATLLRPARPVTVDEAMCILENRHLVFLGDSVTRFCFFGLNTWLETGELVEFDDDWGADTDYDDAEEWTDWKRYSGASAKHQTRFSKDLGRGARTSFYFLQAAWCDDDDTGGETSLEDIAGDVVDEADIILYHHGWWELKAEVGGALCGETFTDDCEDDFRDRVEAAADEILTRDDGVVSILRTSTCCGPDDDDVDWRSAIEKQNAVALDVAADRGVPAVDVYGVDIATFDGSHPDVATCHEMNEMLLRRVDDELGAGCVGAGGYGPTYRPSYRPTPQPSYRPTPQPTKTRYAPSYRPTPRPVERRYDPTYAPTYSPTPRPGDYFALE